METQFRLFFIFIALTNFTISFVSNADSKLKDRRSRHLEDNLGRGLMLKTAQQSSGESKRSDRRKRHLEVGIENELKIERVKKTVRCKIRVFDEKTLKDIPVYIKYSTDSGKTFSPTIWQVETSEYEFPLGRIFLEARGPSQYLPYKELVVVKNSFELLKVPMRKWVGSWESEWMSVSLFTRVSRNMPGDQETFGLLRMLQEASGAEAWMLESPFIVDQPSGRVPKYLGHARIHQENVPGHRGVLIPVQRKSFGFGGVDVLGAKREIRLPMEMKPVEKFFKLIVEGKEAGGVVGIFRPSAFINLSGKRVSLASLAQMVSSSVDYIDIQSKSDERIWYEWLSSAKPMTALKSNSRVAGPTSIYPNHLIARKASDEFSDVLMRFREGKVIVGERGYVNFTLKNRSGKSFQAGDRVLGRGKELVMRPLMSFKVIPEIGRHVEKLELVINGESRQVTKTNADYFEGQAVFGELLFHDGDHVRGRLTLADGAVVECNPIYIGGSWIGSKDPTGISVTFKFFDANRSPLKSVSIDWDGGAMTSESHECVLELPLKGRIALRYKKLRPVYLDPIELWLSSCLEAKVFKRGRSLVQQMKLAKKKAMKIQKSVVFHHANL